MKSCKSTLRKAAMAAMLAGAITTTGGVKAAESPLSMKDHPVVEDIWKRVKEELQTYMMIWCGLLEV